MLSVAEVGPNISLRYKWTVDLSRMAC